MTPSTKTGTAIGATAHSASMVSVAPRDASANARRWLAGAYLRVSAVSMRVRLFGSRGGYPYLRAEITTPDACGATPLQMAWQRGPRAIGTYPHFCHAGRPNAKGRSGVVVLVQHPLKCLKDRRALFHPSNHPLRRWSRHLIWHGSLPLAMRGRLRPVGRGAAEPCTPVAAARMPIASWRVARRQSYGRR